MKSIVGRKLGMTQVFDEETGVVDAVTVIEAGPCPVVAVRTEATDGYDAVQLAYGETLDRKLSKGELVEFRGTSELQAGETVTVEAFEAGDRVKVAGTSIGKGFQGTIKRHNFHRGPASHGSHNVRKPGSIGASATPSRVFKGKKMTQLGLVVHGVDAERNLILVRGAVPGPKSGLVEIRGVER